MSQNNTESNSTNNTTNPHKGGSNEIKVIIIIVVVMMVLFLCFFIYNLIKCYLPKFMNNREERNNKYVDQKDESKVGKSDTGKIEFEEI